MMSVLKTIIRPFSLHRRVVFMLSSLVSSNKHIPNEAKVISEIFMKRIKIISNVAVSKNVSPIRSGHNIIESWCYLRRSEATLNCKFNSHFYRFWMASKTGWSLFAFCVCFQLIENITSIVSESKRGKKLRRGERSWSKIYTMSFIVFFNATSFIALEN